ncbi:hypothetical protein [uncultured Sphingomonas sp.]|uniref:hypothetical protein n=1 Tax=uncultured Sphingomonas sp. TaxID=158754 RepID=UPI0035CB88B9
MPGIDGTYDTVTKTPLGDQKAVLTVKSKVGGWTGSQSGAMGSVDIPDGSVDGNIIKWAIRVTTPMPMTLSCEATVDVDTITGTVTAGVLGSFPMTGTRVS